MRTKKVMSILLAMLLVVSAFTVNVAADTAVLAFASAVIENGQAEVSISLSTTSESNYGFEFDVNYDTTKYTFTSATAGEGVVTANNSFGATEFSTGAVTVIAADQTIAFDDVVATLVFDVVGDVTEVAAEDFSFDNITIYADLDTQISGDDLTTKPVYKAPEITASLGSNAPVSGTEIDATVTAAADNWGNSLATEPATVTLAYQWFTDDEGTKADIEGARDASYTPVPADKDKKIGVRITATATDAPASAAVGVLELVTTGKVTLPDVAPTITVADEANFEANTVVACGAEISLDGVVTITADEYVGGTPVPTYEWYVKKGEAEWAKVDGQTTNAFTPDFERDYVTGQSVYVKCVITAANQADLELTATAGPVEIVFEKALISGNMKPVIDSLVINKAVVVDEVPGVAPLGEAAPIVDDVLSVSYTWEDIAADGSSSEETDNSVVTWTIGDKVVVAETYTVVAEDIGKAISVKVDAVSSDNDANASLGLTEETVVIGNSLEDETEVVAKNPEYVPEVSDVAFDKDTVRVGTAAAISYAFEDKNGFEDASDVKIVKAATADAETWEDAVAGTDYTTDLEGNALANGAKVKFAKEIKGMFVKIVVDPKNTDETNETDYEDVSSSAVEVKAKASSGGGLTGPTLGGATNTPVTPDTPDTPDTPVVVPAAKDCITLTIGKADVNVFGEAKANDVAPVIRNDRTMLPARVVAEALGATVAWDGEARKVTITKGDITIVITIDADKALVNGEEVALDSAAFIESDRTYLPMRFLGEKLGAEVTWNGATQEVYIVPAK